MSRPRELDPLEGIREVFGAYRTLQTLGSNSDLGFVIAHLDNVFKSKSEGPERADKKNETLEKIRTVFTVYKTLSKWDIQGASQVLLENLEQHLGFSNTTAVQETPQLVQVKKEEDDSNDVVFIMELASKVPPTSTTTTIPSKSSSLSSATENIEAVSQSVSSSSQNQDDMPKQESELPSIISSSSPVFSSLGQSNNQRPSNSAKWMKLKLKKVLKTHRLKSSPINQVNIKSTKIPPISSSFQGQSTSLNVDQLSDDEETWTLNSRQDHSPKKEEDEDMDDQSTDDESNFGENRRELSTSYAEINSKARESIHKVVEATLQKSGSPYTLTSKAKKYWCHFAVCVRKNYSSLEFLATHLWRYHTKESPIFNCPHPHCSSTYVDTKSFRHHVKKSHVNRQTHSVSHGNKSKSTENRVIQRQKDFGTETDRKKYSCPYCSKKLSKPYQLKLHIRIHTGEKPFACNHCHKRFTRKDYLKSHEKNRDRGLPCRFENCCSSFLTPWRLKYHEASHRQSSIKRNEATNMDCQPDTAMDKKEDVDLDKSLVWKYQTWSKVSDDPANEIWRASGPQDSLDTDTDTESCSRNGDLEHEDEKDGNIVRKEEPLDLEDDLDLDVPPVLGRRAISPSPPPLSPIPKVRTPTKRRKPGNRSPTCLLCNVRFATRNLLASHERKEHAHPLDRPYPCSFCGERFKRPAHRFEHERAKHSVRHDCEHCPRQFISPHLLLDHLKKDHLNDS